MATPGTEPQRSLFFQPDISRVNSAESNEKKTHGISPQLQAMTFTSLAAEGDMLQKNANYDRAVQSYTKALDFRPGDRITLVSRSRCFMLMGKTELALKDADKVLEGDRNYVRGILQKAETHFTAGDFEQALVFYHRGGKIRPDMEEFRLGIQKAKEAIDDALFGPVIDPGSPRERMSGLNSSRPGSSSGPVDTYRSYASSKPESTGPKSMRSSHFSASNASLTSKAKSQSHPMSATQSSLPQKPTGQHSNATSRRLLGKLYDDKKYLESLAQDKALNKRNTKIQTLAESGLQFLGKREEFWKQQNANDCERQMSPPLRPTSASMADYLVRQSDLASKPALSKSSSRVSNRLYSAGTSRSSQASYQHIPAKKAAHPSHPARRKQESPPSHVFSDQYSSSDGEMNVHNSRKSTEKNARPSSAGFKLKRQTYIEDTQVLVHTLQLINNGVIFYLPFSLCKMPCNYYSKPLFFCCYVFLILLFSFTIVIYLLVLMFLPQVIMILGPPNSTLCFFILTPSTCFLYSPQPWRRRSDSQSVS
eukprot:TRINITY_DN6526_c0_g1_i5.p1 TRINITY_DN6526_c0_g1~~TRINITY_DN6526_c0_g1_i5.p1  ORF type:complete len:536 (-),score=84.23 TRINITY_DN6526_c0_g1_i5:1255-2862(-)